MSGLYYTDLVAVLNGAGLTVKVTSVNAGWETRSRSSGGFPSPPLAVWWHHTASNTSPENDLNYLINGSPDAPVGNMLIDRNGVVWPIAAGASNCAGKGGPLTFSRGTVPQDQGNTRGWQIECAAAGTPGNAWPQVQIDAFFAASNAMNLRFGNQVTDLTTHQLWAPSRKIDPATAADVQGPWRPASCTSSGTWLTSDIQAECLRRSTSKPPEPLVPPEDEMTDDDWKKMKAMIHDECDLALRQEFAPSGECYHRLEKLVADEIQQAKT